MAAKVKGFFKGFKHMSQIFVDKEHEMEIGYPTDVKHVAHIGWDNGSGYSPSWMTEFNTSSDLSPARNYGKSREPSCSSQECHQPRGPQLSLRPIEDGSSQPEVPKDRKKKRKKHKASSPRSSATRSSKVSSKLRASYAKAVGDDSEAQDQRRGV
ncbi:P21-Rho-binding domain [Musa troglodytarum]|uniref:P21-Rho-binding domain n=2 Tax=Musa troglodytarum TaxID=320322 RepID=A0A9E7GCJ9_9LILI|nr:P21-Rho-binding domain [Musa troglodytarum]URE11924.1 P21-Rho-binding domain [Musa troglodytarum]URE11925.1 P21-Rho-binding domain [Musa troglodytarum]